MGKGLCIALVLSLTFIFITSTGCQDSNRFAVAGTGGTLGLGGEFSAKIAPDIKARVGVSQLSFDFDDSADGMEDCGAKCKNCCPIK